MLRTTPSSHDEDVAEPGFKSALSNFDDNGPTNTTLRVYF